MSPLSICQSIIESINNLIRSNDFLESHRKPNRFIRSSGKLSMMHVILYLFYTSKQAMNVNVSHIRQDLPDPDFPKVTKQAVSKARQGILPSLFKDLFSLSTDIFYNNIKKRKMWRGKYNIFAVDGSRISIPSSKCILRSPADSDAFQSGRYAEHNGRSKTLNSIVYGLDHYGVVLRCSFKYRIGRYFIIQNHRSPAVWLSLRANDCAP